MLYQAVKNFLRRQAFVNVDCDGHVADTERRAGVSLSVHDADRQLYDVQGGHHGHAEAVMVTADEEIALHIDWSPGEAKAGSSPGFSLCDKKRG
jgi:hypothetical protein